MISINFIKHSAIDIGELIGIEKTPLIILLQAIGTLQIVNWIFYFYNFILSDDFLILRAFDAGFRSNWWAIFSIKNLKISLQTFFAIQAILTFFTAFHARKFHIYFVVGAWKVIQLLIHKYEIVKIDGLLVAVFVILILGKWLTNHVSIVVISYWASLTSRFTPINLWKIKA